MVRRRLANGPPKHQKGASGMGEARRDATEGGGGNGHFREVLPDVHIGGVFVRGGDVGDIGVNGEEAGSSSCGVPVTGDKFEGKKVEGRFVA